MTAFLSSCLSCCLFYVYMDILQQTRCLGYFIDMYTNTNSMCCLYFLCIFVGYTLIFWCLWIISNNKIKIISISFISNMYRFFESFRILSSSSLKLYSKLWLSIVALYCYRMLEFVLPFELYFDTYYSLSVVLLPVAFLNFWWPLFFFLLL